MSGAGKVVGGILRRRPCFFCRVNSGLGSDSLPCLSPRRQVICVRRRLFAECATRNAPRKSSMSAEHQLTSDVIGLTKVAPFSRRGFMTASAAVATGYTLAAGPVRADVIKTDTTGLTCLLY